MNFPKIVVLTPIRNEEWILELFLKVTEQFADVIIVADQNSDDDSLAICKSFSKVHVIHNSDSEYNEASRQALLIKFARSLVPEKKILLALDADEILAGSSISSSDWSNMLTAKPGTVLLFEKPNVYDSLNSCVRYPELFPGGYVDDGATHTPKIIHSIRIPAPENAQKLELREIKFLHYALLRPAAQAAKMRMYSVIENVAGTKNIYQRRRYYDSQVNWLAQGQCTSTDPEWFNAWSDCGIDMKKFADSGQYWQDRETLKYFSKYGTLRFWLDDIWECDWRNIAKVHQSQPVSIPPKIFRKFIRAFFNIVSNLANLKRRALTS